MYHLLNAELGGDRVTKHKLLTRAEYKYIEDILYRMDQVQQEVGQLRGDILYGSPCMGEMVAGGKVTSRTESAAVRLVSSPRLQLLQRYCDAFEIAMRRVGPEHKDVYEWHFRKGLHPLECQCKGNYQSNKFYVLRRELIFSLAKELGICNF